MPILLKAGWIFFFNTEANTQQRPPPSGFVQVGFSEAVLYLSSNDYCPAVHSAGMPLSVAVPLPLSTRITPYGIVPFREAPAWDVRSWSCMVNEPATCWVKLAALLEVMSGPERLRF